MIFLQQNVTQKKIKIGNAYPFVKWFYDKIDVFWDGLGCFPVSNSKIALLM